ncbi:MAG: NADH-quinone oxidoreductase subunit H [Candidatus Delongbacteria bacterium]
MNHLLHILLLLSLPPLLFGVINRTKAWFAGRTGPPLLQPYHDLLRLLRKDMVLSTTSTWIFRAGPATALAATLLAGLLLPLGPLPAVISFQGDLVLFAYLLGLARFATTAAALDTGSAFEGMGASRELTFACLTEPAIFLALLVLARLSGSLSLGTMLQPLASVGSAGAAPLAMISIGLFVVLLAECSRIPVDDPNTHLELTMIHEVMVLDHSGPLLGAIHYGAALKLFVLGSLLLQAGLPFHADSGWLDGLWLALELLGLAVLIGVVESVMARLRMRQVPYFLMGALLFCGFGFLLLVR